MVLKIEWDALLQVYGIYIFVAAVLLFWMLKKEYDRWKRKKEEKKMNPIEINAFRTRLKEIWSLLQNREKQAYEEMQKLRKKFDVEDEELKKEYEYLYNKLKEMGD